MIEFLHDADLPFEALTSGRPTESNDGLDSKVFTSRQLPCLVYCAECTTTISSDSGGRVRSKQVFFEQSIVILDFLFAEGQDDTKANIRSRIGLVVALPDSHPVIG